VSYFCDDARLRFAGWKMTAFPHCRAMKPSSTNSQSGLAFPHAKNFSRNIKSADARFTKSAPHSTGNDEHVSRRPINKHERGQIHDGDAAPAYNGCDEGL